jgi:hypothetical protein
LRRESPGSVKLALTIGEFLGLLFGATLFFKE